MGKDEKTTPTPQSVTRPEKYSTLLEAFPIQSEEAARYLLEEAAKAIYSEKEDIFDFDSRRREVTQEETNMVFHLLRDIKPENQIEALLGVQIVVGHLLGLRKLAKGSLADINIGLKLLKSSASSIERLSRLRNGCNQNISVTYHNSGPSVQAVITKDQSDAK